MSEFRAIPIEKITTGERFRKDCGSLQELATSISKIGLLHPIIVQEKGDTYTLLAGFRRLQAIKSLDLKVISANIMEGKSND